MMVTRLKGSGEAKRRAATLLRGKRFDRSLEAGMVSEQCGQLTEGQEQESGSLGLSPSSVTG